MAAWSVNVQMDKATKRLEKLRGLPLQTVASKALMGGGQIIAGAIRSEAPRESMSGPKAPWGADDGPGQLRGAVKARTSRLHGKLEVLVGPTQGRAPHRGLVTHGHVVYSHGERTGFRTEGDPFVIRAANRVEGDVRRFVARQILDLARR